MPHVRTLLMAVLTACCGLAFAQQAAPMNAEQRKEARAQIALERKASEERLASNEKACYQHFAVTDCLQKVRSQANADTRALRVREQAINAAERAERTANQRGNRDKKQNDFERKHPPLDGGALSDTPPDLDQAKREHDAEAAKRAKDPKRTPESIATEQQRRSQDAAQRAAEQQKKNNSKQRAQERHNADRADNMADAQEDYDAKQAAAAKRQAAHDKRMKDKEGKRQAAPLPVPQ